jgi:hypothetical protein
MLDAPGDGAGAGGLEDPFPKKSQNRAISCHFMSFPFTGPLVHIANDGRKQPSESIF